MEKTEKELLKEKEDAEKAKEEAKAKKAKEESEKGDKSTAAELIKQQNEATERMEESNDRREKLIEREEQLAIASGRSEAGQEKPSEFTDEEKASRARIKAVGDASGSPWAKKYE